MSIDQIWMGRRIDDMTAEELAAALKQAARLLRSELPASFRRPYLEVKQTPTGTLVGRTFRSAFIPVGYLWTDEDRTAIQRRLDEFSPRHGLQGATVRFGAERLDIEVPRRLDAEQILALQEWLDAEKESLDVSQVP
jgi:hypothetical protein